MKQEACYKTFEIARFYYKGYLILVRAKDTEPNGTFMAQVAATRAGQALGESHLGECEYDPPYLFLESGYLGQMTEEAVKLAERHLAELNTPEGLKR